MTKPKIMHPIVIGGTGGSGTRLIQQLFVKAEYFMGNHVNHTLDTQDFEPWLERWINPVLENTQSNDFKIENLNKVVLSASMEEFFYIINEYSQQISPDAEGWGWKNPRMIFLLPIIHHLCPDMHFVHVIRDGRDMALSQNQNQRRKHYKSLFSEAGDDIMSSLRLWEKVNSGAADYAQKSGMSYTLLRYEELCGDESVLQSFLDRFHLNITLIQAKTLVKPSTGVGRYKTLPPQDIERMNAWAGASLKRFGYTV